MCYLNRNSTVKMLIYSILCKFNTMLPQMPITVTTYYIRKVL